MPLTFQVSEILTLLYPVQCVSCGRGDREICVSCESSLISFRSVINLHGKPLYSSLHYNEISAHLVLSAKESNDRAAARYLAALMAMRFGRIHRDLGYEGYEGYVVVPIPSSKKADKRRGYAHMVLLSRLVAREIRRSQNLPCRALSLLSPSRPIADQSMLTARERVENVQGALRAKSGVDLAGRGIVLVDDLVTTGSTMGEAIRALNVGGYDPDALLSACVAGRFLANKIGRSAQGESG
jgi:ComF family protein